MPAGSNVYSNLSLTSKLQRFPGGGCELLKVIRKAIRSQLAITASGRKQNRPFRPVQSRDIASLTVYSRWGRLPCQETLSHP